MSRIGKILRKFKSTFHVKVSYDDTYLNESMAPDEIRKRVMKDVSKNKSNK